MYCIVVKNVIREGERDAYLAAMLPNARASVEEEAGCLAFDVLEAREEANTFYLYEIYTSPAALEEHKQTAHYLKSRPLLAELLVETSVLRADVVARNPGER
ncbi:MAG: antibiotic biosynthesis monooxygenase [Pseudazoarcus pumilus]|nr:antibiotic biosynthesis monooxygenase [Pseudazoarcus pumilus]